MKLQLNIYTYILKKGGWAMLASPLSPLDKVESRFDFGHVLLININDIFGS